MTRTPRYVTPTARGEVRWYAVGEPIVGEPAPDTPRVAAYRAEVRRTMRAFSDEALRFQDSVIIGGIDREECNRELARRGL